MEVQRRDTGGGGLLGSANGLGLGVWSKHSSQRISTIRWEGRNQMEAGWCEGLDNGGQKAEM